MTIDDSVIDSKAEEPQQQEETFGDNSLMKSSIQDDDVEEKSALDSSEGQVETAAGSSEIIVANAVITGWQLNLVLVW
jgi:hypothetical protein